LSGCCDHPADVANANIAETTAAIITAFMVGPPRWYYDLFRAFSNIGVFARARVISADDRWPEP